MASTQRTGQRGEQLAIDYLRRHGYTIVATNWHCSAGEIDIIAQCEDTLVFVEVRSRHSETTESAFASITPRKQERLVNSIYTYLDSHDLPSDTLWRVDVIAVALRRSGSPLVEHVENALGW